MICTGNFFFFNSLAEIYISVAVIFKIEGKANPSQLSNFDLVIHICFHGL